MYNYPETNYFEDPVYVKGGTKNPMHYVPQPEEEKEPLLHIRRSVSRDNDDHD